MIKVFRWQPDRVEVIRTRIDVSAMLSDLNTTLPHFAFDDHLPVVMMISSFDATKEKSLRQVMSAVELLLTKDLMFQMVFIGGKGDFWHEMKSRGETNNKKMQKDLFVFTGPVIDAYKLLIQSDVVIGGWPKCF